MHYVMKWTIQINLNSELIRNIMPPKKKLKIRKAFL